MRVAFTGTHIHIRDSAPITVGNGCVIDETGAALCVPGQRSRPATRSATGATSCATSRRTRAASTWAPTTTRTSARSARTRSGTNGLVVQPADVISGTGNDLVTYRSAQRGVRVSLDGQFNDGDRGKENIRPDVEHIEGSNGNDTLIGSNDPNKVEQFTGLDGNDTHRGSRRDRHLQRGQRSRAAPTPSAARRASTASTTAQRTTPVTVDMASLPAQQRRGR